MLDILTRLRTDVGQLTIGTLIQEREAAAVEIERLHKQLNQGCATQSTPPKAASETKQALSLTQPQPPLIAPGALLRASEVRTLMGVAHSTLYRWIADGSFPRPVRVSERAVRWRSEDVAAWRDRLK